MSSNLHRDRPKQVSIKLFREAVPNHSNVDILDPISNQLYRITRFKGDPIIVYLTDVYTVGIAEYHHIRSGHPEVTCIVTMSQWNGYTRQAKEQAAADKIGLFVFVEFMGALNNVRYWKYAKKNSNGEPIMHFH